MSPVPACQELHWRVKSCQISGQGSRHVTDQKLLPVHQGAQVDNNDEVVSCLNPRVFRACALYALCIA